MDPYSDPDPDADPYLWLMDPDSDPGGPKTCGSGGSGSGSATLEEISYLYLYRDGVYEFEHFRPGMAARPSAYADNPVEQPVKMAEEGVIDLMDFDMDPDEEEKIRRSLEEKTKYKEVAPTWELNIEKYGTYHGVHFLFSVGERLNSFGTA